VLRFRLMVKRGPITASSIKKEKRSMDHFAGLDVSVKETSICIVDDTGRIVREVKVASEPEALLKVLGNQAYRFKQIGLEAGPLSQWLFSALAEAELPAVCVETRHMQAVLKAQINKTDRNDARGIAQMIRVGLYRPVHVKTLRSQKLRMLLTHRKLLQSKAIAIENDLRGTLRNFGLKVGMVGKVRFEARIQELVEYLPDLSELVEPLLIVRRGATRADRHPTPPLAGHRARRRGVPAPDDDPRCRPRGGADLTRHR
jgi:transposase